MRLEVQLFGEPMRMPSGPAFLSLGTGAPLLPASVFTTRDGWHTRIEGPIEIERSDDLRADVGALTRRIAEHFERYISAAPTDWHMLQPVWDAVPGPAPAAAPAPAGATAP